MPNSQKNRKAKTFPKDYTSQLLYCRMDWNTKIRPAASSHSPINKILFLPHPDKAET